MSIKRITACVLALMICLRTPVCASAADVNSLGNEQETAAVEGETAQEQIEEEQTAEEQDSEEQAVEEQASEETAPEVTAPEEIAPEETAAEGIETEDNEDTAAEKNGRPEQAAEEADTAQAGTVTGTGTVKEQAESEEVTEEIIESEAAFAEEQNSAADAVAIPTTWTVTGWHRFGTYTFYIKQNLTPARGITKIGNAKYIFDPVTGQLRTGLVTIGGATYLQHILRTAAERC